MIIFVELRGFKDCHFGQCGKKGEAVNLIETLNGSGRTQIMIILNKKNCQKLSQIPTGEKITPRAIFFFRQQKSIHLLFKNFPRAGSGSFSYSNTKTSFGVLPPNKVYFGFDDLFLTCTE